MTAWLLSHRRAAANALQRLKAGAGSSALTVLALAVVLVLPAAGHWLVDGLERAGSRLAGPGEVSLWLADGSGKDAVAAIEKRLADAGVARWRFVSKAEALASLESVDGLAEVAAGLAENPLPDSFLVEPARADAEGLAAFAEAARDWPGIAEVHADVDWARRLAAVTGAARRVLWLLSAILAVALVAVSFNTIRLQVAARQNEIDVALLIGATPAWAARPFLWLGALEGLAAGLLAVAALYAIHGLAAPGLLTLAGFLGDAALIEPPSARLAATLLGGAVAIGWSGARLSVARIG
jgi:cell division transport system permease protein